MNRSRLFPIFSAMLGSTSAFVVLTRWGLLGTLTGAVMFPVVYTIASTGSKAGMERINKWNQTRRQNGEGAVESERSEPSGVAQATSAESSEPSAATPSSPDEEQPDAVIVRSPRRLWTRTWRRLRVQWPVTVVAVIALGVSVYALTQADFIGKVIVKETVVEKTVTVTTEVPRTSVVYVTVPVDADPADQTVTTVAEGDGVDEGADGDTSGTTDTTLPGEEPTSSTEPPTTSTTLP